MKWHSVRGRGFLRNLWEENVIFSYVLWYLTMQINTVHYGLLKWMISVRSCGFLTINRGGVDEINLLITCNTIYHGWFWIFHASLARSADGTWVMVRGTEIFPLCDSYKCFIKYYFSADFVEFPHFPIYVPWLRYQSKKQLTELWGVDFRSNWGPGDFGHFVGFGNFSRCAAVTLVAHYPDYPVT